MRDVHHPAVIDLRSDTVTRPSQAMLRAVEHAEVGDDVFGDDPTVRRLEETVAERLGKESAVFVTSGTQSNLCALLAHCQRGDEYIAGDHAHTYVYEAGGGAVLGSIQPQPVRMLDDGLPDPAHVDEVVKPDDPHFARTRLVCVENTHDGKVQTIERMNQVTSVARRRGLATHLDGARMWNAIVELDADPVAFTAPFDTVSMCLSKGLGAPAGSVLSGPAELIGEARRWRKMLGGAMRQSGLLAAAGLHALDHNVERLAHDHTHAAQLAEGLAGIDGLEVVGQHTNMVFVELPTAGHPLELRLRDRGVEARVAHSPARLVTHLDIGAEEVEAAVRAFADALAH
jgi:threonine aldolase